MSDNQWSYALSLINIDVIWLVAERTILSPFFTFWIPIIAICQNSRDLFNKSSIWFLLITLRSIITWSSRSWINRRLWRSPHQVLDWSDQIVLITGGSSGLGRVLVETLVLKYATVIVLDLVPFDQEKGEQEGEEGDVRFFKCDVTDPKMIQSVARRIQVEIGHPTILINNAGIIWGKKILDLEPEQIQRTFGVNVLSHFYILKAFLPEMIKRKSGHIVTVSSVLGELGVARAVDYCASKAATSCMHRGVRQELNSKYDCHEIRTTLVCPGKVSTKMFEKMNEQNQFMYPAISPHDLTKKIIQSLNYKRSEEIYTPLYTKSVWILKQSPYWILDLAHWFAGSNNSLDQFS